MPEIYSSIQFSVKATLYLPLTMLMADVPGAVNVSIIYEEQGPQILTLDDDHDGNVVIDIWVDQHNPQQRASPFYSSYCINGVSWIYRKGLGLLMLAFNH